MAVRRSTTAVALPLHGPSRRALGQRREDGFIGGGRDGDADHADGFRMSVSLTRIGSSGRNVLPLAARNDPQDIVGQRPLKRQGVGRVRLKPKVDFGRLSQNDRHGLGMDRRDDRVGLSRQKSKQFIIALTGALLGPRTPRQGVHRPAKAKSGLSSARRTTSASCAASCRRIRKTTSPGRCSGFACRASLASAGLRRCGCWSQAGRHIAAAPAFPNAP